MGLRAELDARLISNKFNDAQESIPPDPLFHYTTQEGFLGIIHTSEILATKVQYMNDSTEFGRAVDIAKERINSHTQNQNTSENALLKKISNDIDNILNINICCVSFCSGPDLLSQWRGYWEAGVGYAIGFYSAALMEAARHNDCRFGRCIYDEQSQIEIIDELIEQVLQRSVSYRETDPSVVNASLSKAFAEGVIEFGAFFKDSAFRQEDEWRLVTNVKDYHDPAFGFRPAKSTLIPYYRLKIGIGSWRNRIARITVGPCPHPQTSQMAVMGLLVSQFVTTDIFSMATRPLHPPVIISNIRYRNW